MKSLHLDFSDRKIKQRQQSTLVVLILLIIIAIAILVEHQKIKSQIELVQSQVASGQQVQMPKKAKLTEADYRKIKQAKAISQKLNFPWQELWNSLEASKQALNSIVINSIVPNPIKGEVLLTAQAPNLKTMLDFVSSLENQAKFQDVFLLNQRKLESDGYNGLMFTIKIGWQV